MRIAPSLAIFATTLASEMNEQANSAPSQDFTND